MKKTGVSAPAFFSVLSYNIHVFGNSWASYLPNSTKNDELRASQIAAHLQKGNFEFIALQELFEKAFVKKFHQLNFFKSIYATPTPKKSFFNILPPLMPDGLLLLSKYRITDCTSIPLSDSKGMEKMVSRSVMCGYVPANVKKNSHPFCIFTTHTHWGGDDAHNRAVRMKNIKQLRDIVDMYCSKHGNVGYLILADLNITQGREDYDTLMRIFSDCGDANGGNAPTCDPENNKLLQQFHPEYIKTGKTKIDYILYSKKHWKSVRSAVLKNFVSNEGEDLSDHYPVHAILAQRIG